jgi:hypothetical protein
MELKGRDILKIKLLFADKSYDVVEGHRFHNQKYNTYTFDGKPFNVNQNDEFVKWRDSGILYSADFKPATYQKEIDGEMKDFESLQLLTCTNLNQEVAMAKGEALLNRIYRDAEITAVDADFMSEFVNN